MIEQKLTVYEWTDDSESSGSDGVVVKSEEGTAEVVFGDADETGTVEHRMERIRKLSELSSSTRQKGRQECEICLALFENHQRVCY